MCNSEWADRHETRYHPSYEELRQDGNDRRIQNQVKGTLAPTKSEWLAMQKKAN